MEYITLDSGIKASGVQRKARPKVKGKPGQSPRPVSEENQKDDEILSPTHLTGESSSDKQNKSEERKVENFDLEPQDQLKLVKPEATIQEYDDDSDEGWQEAVSKNRYLSGRRNRPSLTKLNTNFKNTTQQTSRSNGKSANFTSLRASSDEISVSVAGSTSSHASKMFVKNTSLNRKQNSSSIVGERPVLAVPACIEQINKPTPMLSPVNFKAGKLVSYKEVALAPPGTILKLAAEQLQEEMKTPENLDEAKIAVDGPEKVIAQDTESENKHVATEMEKENTNSSEREKVIVGRSEMMSSTKEIKNVEVVKAAEEAFPTETAESNAQGLFSEGVQTVEDSSTCLMNKSPTAYGSDASGPEIRVKLQKDLSDAELKATDGKTENLPNGDSSPKCVIPADGEKQEACKAQKVTSKKLSASAPSYTPITVPIFGWIPGSRGHDGILPTPLNMPPMLHANHVHRSTPYHSVTTRVPYGPRLSGYNRYGNRALRKKPSFPKSTESNGEANQSNGTRIMSPHAADFILSQPWYSNGYPVPPNGYIASSNGADITHYWYPLWPLAGGYMCYMYVTQPQNGLSIPAPLTLEELPSAGSSEEKSRREEESDNEKEAGEEEEAIVPVDEVGTTSHEISDEKNGEQQRGKYWGDYSDDEI